MVFIVGSVLCLETAAQDPHQVLLALSAANTTDQPWSQGFDLAEAQKLSHTKRCQEMVRLLEWLEILQNKPKEAYSYLYSIVFSFHAGFISVKILIKQFTTQHHVLRLSAPPNTGFQEDWLLSHCIFHIKVECFNTAEHPTDASLLFIERIPG